MALPKLANIKTGFTRNFARTKLRVKEASPEILLGVGIIGVVTAGVLACKATLELNDILEEEMKKKTYVLETIESGARTEEEGSQMLKSIKISTMLQIARKYAPAVGLAAVSLGCIIEGHHILSVRNLALATSLESVDTAFREYRRRVTDKYGDDVDRAIMYGTEKKEVEVGNPDGTVEKKVVEERSRLPIDYYSYLFEQGHPHFSKNPRFNLNFIQQGLTTARYRLNTEGYISLADVLKLLDFPIDAKSMDAGWIAGDPECGVIDAGIEDYLTNPGLDGFLFGDEPCVWLQFNCKPNLTKRLFQNKGTHICR